MARYFSNVKLLSAVLVDGVSTAFSRRGYAAAAPAQTTVTKTGSSRSAAAAVRKTGGEAAVSPHKVSWGPDPKTGCYRPENGAAEIDAAELRAALLKQSN